ncbi:uncharacterized protein LOC124308968 [Neodiprion virginianus]|uniref:uncharacterized protein LOC124308968 n=1 Tax=Neodiprion virginianus TaxID=2961670 RepID=UPI001EE6C300|nr:uncharacterized protein LOC124308968 [Neodiprion virginianus]
MEDPNDSDTSEWTHLSHSSNGQQTVIASLKRILVGKVFTGEYVERHYVDVLSTYRDLVVVNTDEADFSTALIKASKMTHETYGRSLWFGVTDNEHDGTPKGYCLWVNLFQIPLGKHWFQVQSVDLYQREICLRLKHLRPFHAESSQATKRELVSSELIENFDLHKFYQELEWSQVQNFVLHLLVDASAWCILHIKKVLTYENIRETIKFCSVLMLVIVTFLIEASKFLCDYSLKLIRELSNVIRSTTPITMGIIQFFTKCVGGFYLLIVMLWRGSTGPPIPPNAILASFNPNSGWSGQRAIKYPPQAHNRYGYGQRVHQPRGRFSDY